MSVTKNKKVIRQMSGQGVEDIASIQNTTYNEAAGAVKQLNVGGFLMPLNDGAGAFTTVATTAKSVRKGQSLAVYNKSGTVQSISFGTTSGMAALAIGITDVDGNVGCACAPNAWTYFNSNEKNWIRTDSANLVVYIIKDETYITAQGT